MNNWNTPIYAPKVTQLQYYSIIFHSKDMLISHLFITFMQSTLLPRTYIYVKKSYDSYHALVINSNSNLGPTRRDSFKTIDKINYNHQLKTKPVFVHFFYNMLSKCNSQSMSFVFTRTGCYNFTCLLSLWMQQLIMQCS